MLQKFSVSNTVKAVVLIFQLICCKPAYYNDFWRTMWHWRMEIMWKFSFAITQTNHILKYIKIENIYFKLYYYLTLLLLKKKKKLTGPKLLNDNVSPCGFIGMISMFLPKLYQELDLLSGW